MLEEIFIKNYKNIKDNNVRNKYGILASLYGIITNLLLGLIKIVIGLLANSISILSDAINNITDSITSIITFFGFKTMNKKSSANHPYGYARFEYITNIFIVVVMLILYVFIIKESINKIINPSKITISYITLFFLILSIFIKYSQYRLYKNYSIIIKSNTLLTNAFDSRNDIISTSTIFLSILIIKIFNLNIDGYIGLFLALYFILNTLMLLKESVDELIGTSPDKELINKIYKKLNSYKNILGFHDLVLHSYGVNKYFVSVHIEMDENITFLEAHEMADLIETDFYNELNMNITVHMDPVKKDNESQEKLKNNIVRLLKKLNKDMSIHDFRVIKNKVYFDILEPYEANYKEKDIINYLNDKINHKYVYVIKIDRPMY